MPIFSTSLLWTPADINTALWLDASDTSTIILNGSNVSQWNDKSGNGRNATQSTGALQPTYTSNARNGLAVVEFNPASNTYQRLTFSSIDNYKHLFFVAKKNDVDDSQVLLTDGSAPDLRSLSMAAGTGSNMTVQQIAPVRTDFTRNVWHIGEVMTNGTTAALGVDGSRTTGAETDQMTSSDIGWYRHNVAEYVNQYALRGMVGEIVISATELSDADRQRVEGYLAWKWGLTASLPSNHPYKTKAPTIKTMIYSTQIASGLVGWWKLDETSGTTAYDSTTYGNNGVLQGGLTFTGTTGTRGKCLSFPGVNTKYVKVTDPPGGELDFAGDFSGGCWMKFAGALSSTADEYTLIMKGWNNGSNGWAFALRGGTPYKGIYYRSLSAATDTYPATDKSATLTDGNWHHLFFTRLGTTLTLYLDGVTVGTGTDSFDYSASTWDFIIGAWSTLGSPFNGLINDVRIYNRALSNAEVANLYLYRGRSIYATIPYPAKISTALWLDASDTSTIILNGSNVSQWNDKSGNGRHASQATAEKQPEFFANGKNNLGMIYFDGGNDIMLIASTPLFSSNQYADISIFAAYKFKMTSGQYGCIFGNYLSGNLEFMGGGQVPYLTPWGIWNGQTLDLDSGVYTQNLDWIVSAVRTSGVWTGYTNGTTKNSLTDYVSVYTGANTESIWSIGANTIETEGGKFDLYEIICVNGTVSTEVRQRIEGYLAWKWGLRSSLPSDHPYKNIEP